MRAVPNSTAPISHSGGARLHRADAWRTTRTLPNLLDTRVVRVELARLRGPTLRGEIVAGVALRAATSRPRELEPTSP